jgi:hypothetical protein
MWSMSESNRVESEKVSSKVCRAHSLTLWESESW